MPDIQSMIGKEVEVYANGIEYRGVLIEVSDEEVHLKTAMQWIALPAAAVSAIHSVETSMQRVPEPATQEAPPESSPEGT